jgi:hypothetical protein
MVLVAAIPAVAQPSTFQKMDEAAIQRSLDIQAQVAKIDQDKEAFIREFMTAWTPYVNRSPLFSNFAKELLPLARAATPWTLYAASLVGDYNGMVQVLRGEVRAGKVINALSAPQPKTSPASALRVGSPSPIPFALGATTSQLVFTPITPCRIADTRGSGARTGILLGGVPRTFDLTTDAFLKGQGGSTSCPGLPAFSYYGWSVNATVTGYSTSGYLQAYPFGGSVPATSLVNFGPALPAIANSGTMTGCYGCGDDINILVSAPAHVILDVYGYYELPTGYATGAIAITQVAGTLATVAAGAYSYVPGGSCPAGTTVIGGGQANGSGSTNTILTSDHNISGLLWYEYVKNTGTSAATVTVYSTCQDVT